MDGNEEKLSVDDGSGLYSNEGLIDTLIVDCNRLTQHLASGQYVQYCNTIVQMVQKLSSLKEGIRKELEDRDSALTEMKRLCDEQQERITGLPVVDDVPAISEEALP